MQIVNWDKILFNKQTIQITRNSNFYEFFIPDDSDYFFNDFPGEKYLRLILILDMNCATGISFLH